MRPLTVRSQAIDFHEPALGNRLAKIFLQQTDRENQLVKCNTMLSAGRRSDDMTIKQLKSFQCSGDYDEEHKMKALE